jgi:hypothetical protein
MTRRRPAPALAPDPLAQALIKDREGLAGDLTAVFEAIKGYDASEIHGILYKKPDGARLGYTGKFSWIEDVPAPFDFTEIYTSLKARFGGGDYRMTIMARGVIAKQHEFSIFGPSITPGQPVAAPASDAMKPADMLALMMTQAAEARREAQDQQRFFMEQQSARDARLMATLGVVVPVLAPLLFGNREKLSDVLAMMRDARPPNDLKDTVETFAALKTVFGGEGGGLGGGGGLDPDDIVGSIGRIAGPALAAVGRALDRRPGAAPVAELAAPAGDGLLHLPGPDPAGYQPNPPPANGATPAAPSGSPILDLVKPHVAYFFSAHLDPGLAAEAIADIMTRAQVAQGDLDALVASFTLSADWLADLAAQGLDLRADPAWAAEFLSELRALWDDAHSGDDDSDGGGRRAADVEDDAPARAPGLAINGDSRPGA